MSAVSGSMGAAAGATATEALLVQNAESDPSTNASLIKKALKSDETVVQTLLPMPAPIQGQGGLDIRA